MKDKVFIHELTVFASIGVYDWEHTIKQKLLFNIEMIWDCRQAAETDNVHYCLNYAEVSQAVIELVESQHFALIETVAYRVADLLQSRFGVQSFRVELHKPKAVAQANSLGVIIERGEHYA